MRDAINMVDIITQGKQMKAIEVTGSIDAEGNLILDQLLQTENYSHKVRVIVLFSELEEEDDPDDTPVEEIKASLRRALKQAKAGQTRPISELWSRIDAE